MKRDRIMAVCVAWMVASATQVSFAQTVSAQRADRVWIEPVRPTAAQSDWYPRSVKVFAGTIVDLDAKQVRFVVAGDEVETRVAAERLLWFDAGKVSETELAAVGLFTDGKYAESVLPLVDVLNEKPPVWRQQWLSMLAANAAWRSSRSKISLELVSQLDRRPLAPIVIAYLPVSWRGGAQEAGAIAAANERLADQSPAVRLVAASWLLSSPARSEATSVLKQLSVNRDRPLIARLAESVLWRVATPPQVSEHWQDWQSKLDALPMVLQVGPTVTLIKKLRSAGQSAAADRLELSLQLTPPHPHPDLPRVKVD